VSDSGLTYPVTIPTPNTHSTTVASVVSCPYKRADFINPMIATTTVTIIRYPVKGGWIPATWRWASISLEMYLGRWKPVSFSRNDQRYSIQSKLNNHLKYGLFVPSYTPRTHSRVMEVTVKLRQDVTVLATDKPTVERMTRRR